MSRSHLVAGDGAIRRREAASSPYHPSLVVLDDDAVRRLGAIRCAHHSNLLANVRLALGVALLVFGVTKPRAVLSVWSHRRRVEDASTIVSDLERHFSSPVSRLFLDGNERTDEIDRVS